MKKPVKIGENCWVEAAEIAAELRQDGKLLVFLRSGKVVIVPDSLSKEERNSLIYS